jgi:hypothetical protein
VIRATAAIRTVLGMTSTDLHSRSRVQREQTPTKGAARIDAILAVIDRGLDEAAQPPRYRPDCEQFCTVGRTSGSSPAIVPELTVLEGTGRRPARADGRGLPSAPSTQKEVA